MFGYCPIFFSLGSFLWFDFGSLVVLEFEGFSWQKFSLGLRLFLEPSCRFSLGLDFGLRFSFGLDIGLTLGA